MIRELRDFLNQLLGRAAQSEPPARARPSAAQRAVEGGIRIEYQGDAAQPAKTPASVAWHRERQGMPRFGVLGWGRRVSVRQRLLLMAAAVSIAVLALVLASRLLVTRRLPETTHGVWRTDAPAYADRLFELRARRVAFVTRDSTRPVTVHLIRSVRSTAVDDGLSYIVEYDEDGEALDLRFVFATGPEAEIRFVNQPRLVWRRVSNARSLMPGI